MPDCSDIIKGCFYQNSHYAEKHSSDESLSKCQNTKCRAHTEIARRGSSRLEIVIVQKPCHFSSRALFLTKSEYYLNSIVIRFIRSDLYRDSVTELNELKQNLFDAVGIRTFLRIDFFY